ncbi:MAG: FliH/SctL family protein [Armatimonadota bacterium]
MSNVVTSGFQSLNQDQLFGQIPRLSADLKRVSNRLSDQVDLLKEKGYEDGYNAGYENGLKAGSNEGRSAGLIMAQNQAEADRKIEARQFFADWETLRQEFEQAVISWFEQSEEVLTEMSMEVVRQILAAELEINKHYALEIAKDVLEHVTHARRARIMINPSDFALFESHREALVMQSRQLENIEIVQDHSIRSGVVVETDAGIIDATVQTRLELIDNEFRNAA